MFVYLITNAANGKVYVGQHKGRDLQHYLQQKFYEAEHRLKARSYLYAAIRKHGRENFSIEPLAKVSGIMPKAVLDSLEIFCIAHLNTRDPKVGYNICRGGEGFTGPHSEEWKSKVQESWAKKIAQGYKHPRRSSEIRAKIGAASKGHICFPETRLKMSEAQKGRVSPMKGKHHSSESRLKMSEALKGKQRIPCSPETRVKISQANKGQVPWISGRKHSPESRLKMSEAAKGRSPWNKGKHHSPDTILKISEALKGRTGRRHSLESRLKMSKAAKGRVPPMRGRRHFPETILKMSEAAKRRATAGNNGENY